MGATEYIIVLVAATVVAVFGFVAFIDFFSVDLSGESTEAGLHFKERIDGTETQ